MTPNATLRSELGIVHGPGLLHQLILRDLAHELETWARGAPGRGETSWPLDVLIDERNVFSPDLRNGLAELWLVDSGASELLASRRSAPGLLRGQPEIRARRPARRLTRPLRRRATRRITGRPAASILKSHGRVPLRPV
ncbi:MAG: hypothetical protein M3401_04145 [Actinomycetota bacterium]|nr:hypothetical protein [Actinomycetota bacterium]